MSGSPNIARWRLEQGVAYLAGSLLGARLNPGRAEEGLTALRLEGRRLEGLCLLGVCAPAPASGVLGLEECYVRQRDLVAVYAWGTAPCTYLEAIWRVLAAEDLSAGATPGAAVGVELILSIHTERLEDCIQLGVESRFPVEWLLGLSAAAGPCPPKSGRPGVSAAGTQERQTAAALRFERLGPPAAIPTAAQTLPAPVCVVCSLQAEDRSQIGYVEAACPSDVPSAELAWIARPFRQARVRYAVLPTALEKGVILRARVRGVFLAAGVPAEEQPRCAGEVYRALASAAPVLGS